MSFHALDLANWLGETSLVFAGFLVVAAGRSRRLRVTLLRTVFLIALVAPLALVSGSPKLGLMTVPAAVTSTESATVVADRAAIDRFGPAGAQVADKRFPALTTTLTLIWSAGALAVMARYLLSFALLSSAFATGARPSAAIFQTFEDLRRRLGVSRRVELRLSDRVAAPCAFGWARSRILLPAGLRMTPEGLEAVLAHELCHVRNHDTLWILGGHFACAAQWFNPLVWICARRHHADIEMVCDAAVIESAVPMEVYVRALAAVARELAATPARAGAGAGAMMSDAGVVARLRALLDRGAALPRPSLGARVSLCVIASSLVVMFATVQVVAAPTAPLATTPEGADPLAKLVLKPDETLLYLHVAKGVTVWARKAGLMCDGGGCVTTVPKNVPVSLTADAHTTGPLTWSGCQADADGRSCVAPASQVAIHVTVTRGA